MYYVRRRKDNKYLYYINGKSDSYSQLKDAIPFDTLEMAQQFLKFTKTCNPSETFEIVSVEVKITTIEEDLETQDSD